MIGEITLQYGGKPSNLYPNKLLKSLTDAKSVDEFRDEMIQYVNQLSENKLIFKNDKNLDKMLDE